jgi:hypothetical protein
MRKRRRNQRLGRRGNKEGGKKGSLRKHPSHQDNGRQGEVGCIASMASPTRQPGRHDTPKQPVAARGATTHRAATVAALWLVVEVTGLSVSTHEGLS